MPIASLIDGPTRRIYLDGSKAVPEFGVLTMRFDFADLYREVVDWGNSDTSGDPNSRWLFPMRATGGNLTSQARREGTRVFFQHDWALIPADTSHSIIINGAGGVDIETNTTNTFWDFSSLNTASRINVQYDSPNLIDTIEINASGGGGGSGDATLAKQDQILGNQATILSGITAILANQTALLGSGFGTDEQSLVQIHADIAALKDLLDFLGYSEGKPVSLVGPDDNYDMIRSDGPVVEVRKSGNTTTITRNDP